MSRKPFYLHFIQMSLFPVGAVVPLGPGYGNLVVRVLEHRKPSSVRVRPLILRTLLRRATAWGKPRARQVVVDLYLMLEGFVRAITKLI